MEGINQNLELKFMQQIKNTNVIKSKHILKLRNKSGITKTL